MLWEMGYVKWVYFKVPAHELLVAQNNRLESQAGIMSAAGFLAVH